jgi:hypothetical protein
MCPYHIQRFYRVTDPYGGYIHTVDAQGRTITGHYRCDICSQQVDEVYQLYFQRLRRVSIVGLVLCVVGLIACTVVLIAFTVGVSVSSMGPGAQQLVGLLLQVGCFGGPALVIGAGYLSRRRYSRYL